MRNTNSRFFRKKCKKCSKNTQNRKYAKKKVNKGILLKNTPLPNLLRGGLQAEIGWI